MSYIIKTIKVEVYIRQNIVKHAEKVSVLKIGNVSLLLGVRCMPKWKKTGNTFP